VVVVVEVGRLRWIVGWVLGEERRSSKREKLLVLGRVELKEEEEMERLELLEREEWEAISR